MKKLHDFYKKHIVVFWIVLGVMLYLLITAALFAFSYFSGGIESLKRDLASFAVPWGIVAAAFLFLVYATTENIGLRLASTFGFVAVAFFLIVYAIPNI